MNKMESDLKQQPVEPDGGSLPPPSLVELKILSPHCGLGGASPEQQPQVVVSGDLPPVMLPSVTRCVIDMTEEERDAHFKERGEEQYQHYLKSKATGCYSRCRKTDWCKVEREKREKEQKEKEERLKTLEARETIWVDHAKEQEAKMMKMQKDIEKMAGLLSQLISKQ